MSDYGFLCWLYYRLVMVYHESPNADFVLRLRRIVESMTPNLCGQRSSESGVFVCNEPAGHDGCHRANGDNFAYSWGRS